LRKDKGLQLKMKEKILQYVWQHQLFDKMDGLSAVDGSAVKVLYPGELNREAGPDFFNARVVIGNVEWAGNVEIHVNSSDWIRHRHSTDPRYQNVVLHVVYHHDAEIKLPDGHSPATLELSKYLSERLIARCESMLAAPGESGIPCVDSIPQMSRIVVEQWLQRMSVERVEEKTGNIRQLLSECCGDWQTVCYHLLARYYGGNVNALPFELVAKSTPLKLLSRWRDDRTRLEALLMGQAGLLSQYFEDEYPRLLQSDYEALAKGAGLHPIDPSLWRLHGIRPVSFPTLRISQFSGMIAKHQNLFDKMLGITDVEELISVFDQPASDYWNVHYNFDVQQSGAASVKRLGRSQAVIIIINAWIPLLMAYGIEHHQQQYRDLAMDLLTQLPAENNRVVREWMAAGITPENASHSQAMIHLRKTYCNARRCLECSLGYHILKKV